MAVTQSGVFGASLAAVLNNTQLAVNLSLTTNKVAMFTNSITPNFALAGDTAYNVSPYNANEVSGTGYTAGGIVVASPTLTENPTGYLSWLIANSSWTTSTITNARCALHYADALAGKNAISLLNFGADYSTTAGTFTIQYASGGIWALQFH